CVWLCVGRFFFSSRRRHTRWPRDWSSDVCSSDLPAQVAAHRPEAAAKPRTTLSGGQPQQDQAPAALADRRPRPTVPLLEKSTIRSEERRVGKECRYRGLP